MDNDYNLDSYQYELPAEQIAQFPAEKRDSSRLLVMDCRTGSLADKHFTDITDYLQPGDLLVVNDTKVFPARLQGKKETGGKVELFLLEYPDFTNIASLDEDDDLAGFSRGYFLNVSGLLKSSKRPRKDGRLIFSPTVTGKILKILGDGKTLVRLYLYSETDENPEEILQKCGRVPLPPYISRNDEDHPEDRERYQTVYARKSGAVAAPTAGLHFSDELLETLKKHHIHVAPITLHVGYGTFAPVRVKDIRQHRIHEEYVEVSPETAEMINQTRKAGKRVWAVGTTTARTLEFASNNDDEVEARNGWCNLYIYPGYRFKTVNGLITNFHLPGSSLLFLVAALVGRKNILRAYENAIRCGYRFYSYGDAMLIIT
jgi:S-adenosylmethionine:tRNA ribosyltransferase-isomerase